jgi:hypothetical protein
MSMTPAIKRTTDTRDLSAEDARAIEMHREWCENPDAPHRSIAAGQAV